MMEARALPLLCLLAACGDSSEVIRDVTAGLRTTSRVEVSVKAEEADVQKTLENRIEQENIGRLVSSGLAAGYYQVTVEVENTADAIPRIQDILRSMDLDRDAKFRVIVKED